MTTMSRPDSGRLSVLSQTAQAALLKVLECETLDASMHVEGVEAGLEVVSLLKDVRDESVAVLPDSVPDEKIRNLLAAKVFRRELGEMPAPTAAEIATAEEVLTGLKSGKRPEDSSLLQCLTFLRNAVAQTISLRRAVLPT